MNKRQLALMVSIAMTVNIASAQDISVPRENPRLSDFEKTLTPQQKQLQDQLKREMNDNISQGKSSSTNQSTSSQASNLPTSNVNVPVPSEATDVVQVERQVLQAPTSEVLIEPIPIQAIPVDGVSPSADIVIPSVVEKTSEVVVDTISQQPVSVGTPNNDVIQSLPTSNAAEVEAAQQLEQSEAVVAEEVEVVVEQVAAEIEVPTPATVASPEIKAIPEVASPANVEADADVAAINGDTNVPDGITVISEDGDFVVDANKLGDKRRKEIDAFEAYQQLGRCLSVIGVPGDLSMSRAEIDAAPLDLEADNIELPDEQTVVLTGKAVASQGPQQISAERLRYSKNDNVVNAESNVELYSSSGDHLKASSLNIDLDTFVGDLNDVEYQMAERSFLPRLKNNVFTTGRGGAEAGKLLGHDLMRFNNATYTTCPEGNNAVVIKASEIELDYSNNIGTARDAVLRFFGVPIFYLPYYSFPISNERKSGLLSVKFGTDRDDGVFFGTPVYWNIHPQLDATITPWYYSDRGFLLEGEFRYLTDNSDGVLKGAYIPSDDIFGGDRGAITFQHDQEFTDDLDGNVDFQYASDQDYYDDFETDLNVSSSSFLPQRGQLRYFNQYGRVTGGVLNYFSVNENVTDFNQPYERLPYIEAQTDHRAFGFKVGAEANFDYFRHSDRIDGARYNIAPFIEYPIEEVYGYIKPKVEFKYLGYNLNEPREGSDNDSPNVYNTITTVDSKLIFEREFAWAGDTHIQTLEPRIKYAYIPAQDQAAIPDFDTSERNNNNFSSIFEENRFFGNDRIGDTNQVTVGVTSRFINDESGAQRGEFSIGQLYYLEDRQISLDSDNANITDSESDILTEGRVRFYNDWELYGFLSWDPDESETRVRRTTLSYNRNNSSLGNTYLSLGYFFTQPIGDGAANEQATLEAGYQYNEAWSIYGRTIYDIDESESRFLNAGIQYDACCWSLALVGEQSFGSDQQEDTRFFLQFSLTGLTSFDYGN